MRPGRLTCAGLVGIMMVVPDQWWRVDTGPTRRGIVRVVGTGEKPARLGPSAVLPDCRRPDAEVDGRRVLVERRSVLLARTSISAPVRC